MILYPAIDILDGKAVRLVEGRFEDRTVYHDDPLAAARSWVEAAVVVSQGLPCATVAGSGPELPAEAETNAPAFRRARKASSSSERFADRWRRSRTEIPSWPTK